MRYYVCKEPSVGDTTGAEPVAVGHAEEFATAQSFCDNHNRVMGPGLRLYVVPEAFMWTEREIKDLDH